MCGIVGIFNIKRPTEELRQKALAMSKKIRHRGPDWSGIYCGKSAILCHERLSIVDPQSMPPMASRRWRSTEKSITIGKSAKERQMDMLTELAPTAK